MNCQEQQFPLQECIQQILGQMTTEEAISIVNKNGKLGGGGGEPVFPPERKKEKWSCSVVSNSLQPHGL